jgi:hypothetical protein
VDAFLSGVVIKFDNGHANSLNRIVPFSFQRGVFKELPFFIGSFGSNAPAHSLRSPQTVFAASTIAG